MNNEVKNIEEMLENPKTDIPMYAWINLAEYASEGLGEATRAVNDAYKLGAMMGGDMSESQKMALEICEGYATLTQKQKVEFLDLFIDFMKDKLPGENIKALEELREREHQRLEAAVIEGVTA